MKSKQNRRRLSVFIMAFFVLFSVFGQSVNVSFAGEGDYTFNISGTGDLTIRPGAAFNFIGDAGVSFTPDSSQWQAGDEFRLEVTGVDKPIGGTYTYAAGDTSFTPQAADNGKTYTVHYEIKKKVGGAWVPLDTPKTATKALRVFATSQILPMLTSDDAEVTNLVVAKIVDGVGPFDSDSAAGNDSSSDNRIVRTFDSVTYQVGYNTKGKTAGVSYKQGYIKFEFTLPFPKDVATFDTASMGWMTGDAGYKWTLTESGGVQTLKAAKKLESEGENATAIPGSGDIPVHINVYSAKNGDKIQPTFKSWMDYSSQVKTVVPDGVTVSAAPRYNIEINKTNDVYIGSISTFDFSTGNEKAMDKDAGTIYGKLQGYGISLQLYNTTKDKKLKGIELPQGDITFKLDMTSVYEPAAGGSHAVANPKVWSFVPAVDGVNPGQDGRDISTYSNYTYATVASALNKYSGVTPTTPFAASPKTGTNANWYGGGWSIKKLADGRYEVTVKDYKINPKWFPNTWGGVVPLSDPRWFDPALGVANIGSFSAGSLLMVVPFGGSTGQEDPNYYTALYGNGNINTNVKVSDMTAKSVSGQPLVAQTVATDDAIGHKVELTMKGDFGNRIMYNSPTTTNLAGLDNLYSAGNIRDGADAASINSKLRIRWGGLNDPKGDSSQATFAANYLMKFDDEALDFDPTEPPFVLSGNHSAGYSQKFLYAAKPDGKGWTGDDEMNAANEENLVYYPSLASLKAANKVCVGVLAEVRKTDNKPKFSQQQDYRRMVGMIVKNDPSLVGKVYMITEVTNLWREAEYKAVLAANGGTFPTRENMAVGQTVNTTNATKPSVFNHRDLGYYKKYSYNANGPVEGSRGEPRRGDSLYIVGYRSEISKKVVQKDADGNDKITFDLDLNQYVVDYQLALSMKIEKDVVITNPTTIYVKDTLPKGLTYIPGSSYYDGTYTPSTKPGQSGTVTGGTAIAPTVTEQSNGTTVLTWEIPNVRVEANIPDIYFKARLSSTVATNVILKNTASIATTEDKREQKPENGNMSEVSIKTSKTSDISLVKKGEQVVYDLSGPISYNLEFYNNGGSGKTKQVFMDTMPANGQGATNYSGTITLGALRLTAPDGKTPADYEAWYTLDEGVKALNSFDFTYDGIRSGSEKGITWTKATIDASGNITGMTGAKVTAFVVLGDLPAKKVLKLKVTINAAGNKIGDIYENSMSLGAGVTSGIVFVVERKLTGTLWEDENFDGKKDSTERKLAGATVTLYDGAGNVVSNLNGNPCVTTTDTTGSYEFTALPAGTFKVVFTGGASMDLGEYILTEKDNPVAGDSLDSDATAAGSTADGAFVSGVIMPAAATIKSNPYVLRNVDAGLVRNKTVKEYADDSAAGKGGSAVKVHDEITYTVEFLNGDGTLKDVVIEDMMSKGLTYKNGSAKLFKGTEDVTATYLDEPTDSDPDAVASHTLKWQFKEKIGKGKYYLTYKAMVIGKAMEDMEVTNTAVVKIQGQADVTTDTLKNPVSQKAYQDNSWVSKKVGNGMKIPYQVSFNNVKAAPQAVIIKDTMSKGLVYQGDAAVVNLDGTALAATLTHSEVNNLDGSVTHTWQIDNVPPNTKGKIVYSGEVTSPAYGPGKVENKATVKYGNDSEAALESLMNPLVPVKKTVTGAAGDLDGKLVSPDEVLEYTVTYEKASTVEETVTIKDTLPEHTTYVDGSADNGGVYDPVTRTVEWTLTLPAAAGSHPVSFKVKVDQITQGAALENTATITEGANVYITNTTKNPTPTGATKEVRSEGGTANIDGQTVSVNDTLTYLITYQNTLGHDTTAKISDLIPEHTTYVDGSADISGGVYDPATKTVKWDLNVSDGQSVTVSFKVKIDGGAYYARIENQGIVDNGASTVYTNKTDNPVGGPPLPPTPPVPPTPPTPPVPPVPPTPPTPPEPQNPPVDKPEVPKPEKPEPPKTDKPGSHGKDTPKTGDSSQMLLWAALMAGSMLEAGRRMAKKGKK